MTSEVSVNYMSNMRLNLIWQNLWHAERFVTNLVQSVFRLLYLLSTLRIYLARLGTVV